MRVPAWQRYTRWWAGPWRWVFKSILGQGLAQESGRHETGISEEPSGKHRRWPGCEEARVCLAEGVASERPRACSGVVGAGYRQRGARAWGRGPQGLAALSRRQYQPQMSFGNAVGLRDPGRSPHFLWQEPSGPWGKLQAKWPTGSRSPKARTTVARSLAVLTAHGLRAAPPGSLWAKVLLRIHRDGEGSSPGNAHLGPFQTVALTLFFKFEK